MTRSTNEFRTQLKAARRAGTPLLAIRTADPASAMAQVMNLDRASLHPCRACDWDGLREPRPLMRWLVDDGEDKKE